MKSDYEVAIHVFQNFPFSLSVQFLVSIQNLFFFQHFHREIYFFSHNFYQNHINILLSSFFSTRKTFPKAPEPSSWKNSFKCLKEYIILFLFGNLLWWSFLWKSSWLLMQKSIEISSLWESEGDCYGWAQLHCRLKIRILQGLEDYSAINKIHNP